MRKQSKFVQFQAIDNEGATNTIFVDVDCIAFINAIACEVIIKGTAGIATPFFTTTSESMAQLLDTLDRCKLVYGGVK